VTPVRLAAWAGVACPVAAAAVLGVAGWLSPGYDPLRTTISHLGQRGQPFALAVNLSFAALGVAYVAVAWALRRSHGPRAAAGATVLAIAGVAVIGVALISRDPVSPVPHRTAALVFFLALGLAPLLTARVRHRRYSLATFAISAALLLVGLVGVVLGGVPAGAWERTYATINLAWLVTVASGLPRP